MTDLHKLVAEKFKSGNSVAVERITITRKEYETALAQPEQEPVDIHCPSCLHSFSIVPVAKREWVGLTDETLDDVYFCVEGGTTPLETWREQARAIEAKLKEKNMIETVVFRQHQ